MSIAGLLNKTCVIERVTTANTGPEPSQHWVQHLTAVPCRVSMLRANELANLGHTSVAVTHRLYLPYGTDIHNDDRVVLDETTWHVEMVSDDPGSRQHHVEALIRAAV